MNHEIAGSPHALVLPTHVLGLPRACHRPGWRGRAGVRGKRNGRRPRAAAVLSVAYWTFSTIDFDVPWY
jgi:hypothetical protein